MTNDMPISCFWKIKIKLMFWEKKPLNFVLSLSCIRRKTSFKYEKNNDLPKQNLPCKFANSLKLKCMK